LTKLKFKKNHQNGDWGLGIGDWGLGIGDWGQYPKPPTQKPKTQGKKIILIIIK